MKFKLSFFVALLTCLLSVTSVYAQKKAMDHDVYDGWESVGNVQMTPDGGILVYGINPQEGDGRLVVRNRSGKELSIPRGYSAKLDQEGRWLYCLIKPEFSRTRQEKIDKKKADKQTKDSLAVVDLRGFEVRKYPVATEVRTGFDAMPFVAYKTSWKEAADSSKAAGSKRKEGLVVIDPASEEADTILNVDKAAFDRRGTLLSYTVKKDKKDSGTVSALVLVDLLSSPRKKDTLSSNAEFYGLPVFNESSSNLAFTSSEDTLSSGDKKCSLHIADISGRGVRKVFNAGYMVPGTEGWTLTQNSEPLFSRNGSRIFVGIAPPRPPKDTSIVDFETAGLDIWNWDALLTPPQQKLRVERTKKKTYPAVIDLKDGNIVPLGKSFFEDLRQIDGGDGEYAIAMDNTKYMVSQTWDDASYYDIYKVDLKDGSRDTLFVKLNCDADVSPGGKYLIWYSFDDLCWHVYDISAKTSRNLTGKLGVAFYDEENDRPVSPYAYAAPIWTEGDKYVILTDRYDLWRLDPSSGDAVNLTKAEGRKRKVRFRYTNPEPSHLSQAELSLGVHRTIDAGKPVYVTAFSESDKRNGIGTTRVDKSQSPRFELDTLSFNLMVKAPLSSTIAYQKGNFCAPYDLYLTEDNFKTSQKLTAVNPQMQDYRWGKAELFHWNAYDGTPLDGIVFVPDGIKEGEKLPVMIYFYEKNSETLYNFRAPAPSASTVNIPFFVSRGYVVFVPDIVYKTGHPGESAYNAVCSGAEALCKKFPFADKSRMAIQGQSWGGYQTAYLITRTDMFAAAGAGAPVSNMTSAYGGIRWESGITRAGQYEHGQSRIGKNLWEEGGLELYIENSPIFHADKVNTPVLIMHNDADGAVPWYQGIEFFSGLRRLGKPAWMLEYNDEAHNLRERRNRKDLSRRLQQFFDHYLKGDPMPAWMKYGVPADRKGEYFGFEEAE